MYLKSLTLRGFKSFASATTLTFEPGITCVVGPNGSGKSNVVDALSWVMGEQGAKTLRGGAMADVIFAGTSTRPPLGRAEVSLTIDNSDGALPIEYTEVTISRTLFRQGSSEYAINGTPCRLLDIQELLSDSGLGKEMHVIVGQGRLDSVLTATPEDRRGFIEEAAGILKHRRRKEKALRKLDSMGANLARLTDLVGEIRRQLGPLAKQADVARRASKIQADLRDASARLLADDYVQLTTTLEQVIADDTAVRQRMAQAETKINELTASIEELEAANLAAAPQLTEITQMWYQLSSLKERMRSTATVASERHRHVSQAAQEPVKGGRDPEELAGQAAKLRAAEAELAAELAQARADLDTAISDRKAQEQRATQAERTLTALHRGIADRKDGVAKLSSKVSGAASRLEASVAELERLRHAMAAARERSETAHQLHTQAEQALALTEEDSNNGDSGYETAVQDLSLAQESVATLTDEHRHAREEVASWQARLAALEMSVQTKDAMAQLRDLDAGITAAMAELIRVQPKYSSAIAVAFGAMADAAVAPDLATAFQALALARTNNLGVARLIVGAPEHTGSLAEAVQQLPPPPAGSIWALAALDADASLVPALTALLGQVVITENDDEAQKIATTYGFTAITLEGALYATTHVMGGSEVEQNLLHLHTAIDEARHRLEAAQEHVAELEQQLIPAKERVQRCQDVVSQAERDRSQALQQAAKLRQELAQHQATLRAAQGELERYQADEARVVANQVKFEAELKELRAQLLAAQQEPEEDQSSLEAAQTERDAAAEAASQARGAETDARLVLRTLEERTRALGGRAESLERAAQAERRALERAVARAEKLTRQAQMAAFVRDRATSILVRLEESLNRATHDRIQAEELKQTRDEKLQTLRQELTQWQQNFRELSDVVHREDLAQAEHRLRIEQLQDRVMQELGLDTETLVNEYGPHLMIPVYSDEREEPELVAYVRAEQEKRLKAAQRGLSLLGKVNPLALEEHAALEERHRFLNEQLADLKKSRDDLLTIVKEIDERVETVFRDAFADTAVEFEKVFQVLFPGGEGKLVLTDPSDMLTTGIEVEARPAGKKVKRLSLLSGGERSLAAIALLVAIFKARPSPFYVMDEVEAALDDVNLGRLLTIMADLRKTSQLIVITHQKRTMEIADALYGVTMRGDGVTTVISQRLNEES